MNRFLSLLIAFLTLAPVSLAADTRGTIKHSMVVTASAYTTAVDETQRMAPGIGAWGDRLKPGMKVIAVSRDLIAQGLTHGTRVHIKGLKGTWRVLDKMNKRWTRKIDILMGSKKRANEWGKRTVTITWFTTQ